MEEAQPRVWRIRMKVGDTDDFTKEAWNRDEVGVWYGGWSAQDLEEAIIREPSDPAAYLQEVPAQRDLHWDVLDAGTSIRFRDIANVDWVLVYIKGEREIGLAQLCGTLESSSQHPLNSHGEVFKFRKIHNKKSFKLSNLPDAYQLLPTQGRGNVHQFHSMYEHVRLLTENGTEDEVNSVFKQKPFDELLDLLGASAWESFCLTYLILEEGFLPTGLSTGRTLPAADIVGRRASDGTRIVAQCKKHPSPEPIDPDFASLSAHLSAGDAAYYFAYGGCVGVVPEIIRIVDRHAAIRWANSDNGIRYLELLCRRL